MNLLINLKKMSEVCYLKTTADKALSKKYFRIDKNGVVTISEENFSMKKTKGIASSPYDIVLSTEEEFEAARKKIIAYIKLM